MSPQPLTADAIATFRGGSKQNPLTPEIAERWRDACASGGWFHVLALSVVGGMPSAPRGCLGCGHTPHPPNQCPSEWCRRRAGNCAGTKESR